MRYVMVLVLLGARASMANPIFVDNFSFETLPLAGLTHACGVGCAYSTDNIPGWVLSNVTAITGQFQPGVNQGNTTFLNSVPDGTTVAYTNGGTISQTVGATVGLGVTYTLVVDVGQRADCCSIGTVDLVIGNTRIAATGSNPSAGGFSAFTATYTGLASDVGKSIGIELSATGGQGDFDNVLLTDSNTTPEPGTISLVVLGLAATLSSVLKRLYSRTFPSRSLSE